MENTDSKVCELSTALVAIKLQPHLIFISLMFCENCLSSLIFIMIFIFSGIFCSTSIGFIRFVVPLSIIATQFSVRLDVVVVRCDHRKMYAGKIMPSEVLIIVSIVKQFSNLFLSFIWCETVCERTSTCICLYVKFYSRQMVLCFCGKVWFLLSAHSVRTISHRRLHSFAPFICVCVCRFSLFCHCFNFQN